MANPTSNTGLRPLRMRDGRNYSGQFSLYCALSTYSTDLLIGDPVIRLSTGANTATISCANEKFEAGSLPIVQKATAGATNRCTGAIIGFKPVIDNLQALYGAGSTNRVVMVADDPDVVFGIRDYGAIALGVTAIGSDAVFKFGTDNTDKSVSGVRLDDGTTTAPGTDATYQLRIVGKVRATDNDPTIAGTEWEVMIKTHTEAAVPSAGI